MLEMDICSFMLFFMPCNYTDSIHFEKFMRINRIDCHIQDYFHLGVANYII